jgi:hypothetical protein
MKTFRGQLDIGTQKKINLSTADGLMGYKIVKFQIISKTPGAANAELIGQIFTTDQTASISAEVDFNNPALLGVTYVYDQSGGVAKQTNTHIFDKEVFNQDVFINITDATGGVVPANYYLELEQIKLNINESTFATLKNLRDHQQS